MRWRDALAAYGPYKTLYNGFFRWSRLGVLARILIARLKDWRRIATRYDRCADLLLRAIALCAIVMFWL